MFRRVGSPSGERKGLGRLEPRPACQAVQDWEVPISTAPLRQSAWLNFQRLCWWFFGLCAQRSVCKKLMHVPFGSPRGNIRGPCVNSRQASLCFGSFSSSPVRFVGVGPVKNCFARERALFAPGACQSFGGHGGPARGAFDELGVSLMIVHNWLVFWGRANEQGLFFWNYATTTSARQRGCLFLGALLRPRWVETQILFELIFG